MTSRDPHWLGVDNGSTVTKAAVFDAEGRELGALGAAILAATAAGHGPLPAAAARMTRIDRVFEPVASRSRLLEARFARFTQALDALAPWWASSPT